MKPDHVERFREIAPGVRFSLSLLAGISDRAAEGYRKMPWGGAESGGLLLGTRTGQCVWVLECREVNCEHDFGPAFELSSADMKGLEASIEETAQGPLAIVGWYRTTSRELSVTSADVALWDRYFAESWHLTLIVYRSKAAEPKFGVFVKDPSRTPAHRLVKEFTAESASSQPEAGGPKSDTAKSSATPPVSVPATDVGTASSTPREAPGTMADDVQVEAAPIASPEHPTGSARVPNTKGAVIVRPETAPALVVEDIPVAASAAAERGSISLKDEPHPAVEVHREALERLIQKVSPSIPADDWLRFFGLSMNPFVTAPDPAVYVETVGHREAVRVLEYGITAHKGLMLLTGPAGTGKSMMLERAADQLRRKRIDCVRLPHPRITRPAMYELIAAGLGVPASGRNAPLYQALHERAVQRAADGSTVVLIIDDAHKAPAEVLLEMELLNNIENRRGKLLQIVLAGQPPLRDLLDQPEFAGLKQRVALRTRLASLSPSEVQDYIGRHLELAGGNTDLIGSDAADAIHRHTGGTPRLINDLCAASLRFAFFAEQRRLTPLIVDQAAAQSEV